MWRGSGDERQRRKQVRNIYLLLMRNRFLYDEDSLQSSRQRPRDFHCPNGHSQHYLAPEVDPKDAELIKLRAELVDAKTLTAKLQAELDTLKIEVELWRPREDE